MPVATNASLPFSAENDESKTAATSIIARQKDVGQLMVFYFSAWT